jgi:hypothetical protein
MAASIGKAVRSWSCPDCTAQRCPHLLKRWLINTATDKPARSKRRALTLCRATLLPLEREARIVDKAITHAVSTGVKPASLLRSELGVPWDIVV